MPYSFRQRLGKPNANASVKSSTTEAGGASASVEDLTDEMNGKLTLDTQDQQPLIQVDSNGNPPPIPERKPRSAQESSSKTTSPSQSLLDRYKKGTPKASVKTATTNATYKAGKTTAFSEVFGDDSSATSPEWIDVPGAPEHLSEKDTQVHDGIEFEMLGKKCQAYDAPTTGTDDQDFVYERRATRSRTRRQQRADSADSAYATVASDKESSLVPSGLTVKKVAEGPTSRTPSPRAPADGEPVTPGQVAPTPSNSPSASFIPSQTPTMLVVDQTKNKAEYRLSNSPDPITLVEKTTNYGLRRKLPQPPANNDAPPTQVIPPIFYANIRPEYIWTSPLASTSRPEYTWVSCRHPIPS
jgi:hypothetical protein